MKKNNAQEGYFSRIMERMRKPKEKKKEKPEEKKEEIKEEKKIEEPREERKGVTQTLHDMEEKLDRLTQEEQTKKKLKKKQFKMPLKVKKQLKKLAMKNKVQVMLLQNNRNIKPTIGEIKNGILIVGDKYYDGSTDNIWFWNGKFPTIIQPEWDLKSITGYLKSINASELLGDAIENKRSADPQAIIIRAIQLAEVLQAKKPLSGKAFIWIGIGVIVLFYLLFAGGK